jgi:hypothetical protein
MPLSPDDRCTAAVAKAFSPACTGICNNRPAGSSSGVPRKQTRVLRGGSWNNNADNARGVQRNRNSPDNRNDNNGFRVVSSHIPASANPGEIADHGLRYATAGLKWRGCIPSARFASGA